MIEMVKGQIKELREYVTLEAYAGCKGCQLPQDICARWTVAGRGFTLSKESRCQWRYVVIDVVATLMVAGYGGVKDEDIARGDQRGSQCIVDWIARDGVETQDTRKIYRWYRGKVRIGLIETCRLCIVFQQLTEAFRERPEEFQLE